MYKFFFRFFLLITLSQVSFADVYMKDSNIAEGTAIGNRPKKFRSAFFMQGNVGLVYQYYGYETTEVDYYNRTGNSSLDYNGFGTALSLKMGFCLKELIAFHGLLGLTETMGDWDYHYPGNDGTYENDNGFYRIMLGAGITAFPFRKLNNTLKTVFFGADMTYTFLETLDDDRDDYSVDVDKLAFSFRLEAGQVWPLGSSRWNIGYESFVDFDAVVEFDDPNDSDDEDGPSSWSIGIAFTIMRK